MRQVGFLLHLAGIGEIAVGVGYALGVLAVIAAVCFAVIKAFGRSPRRRDHKRGTVGAGAEAVDPDDGTPHTTDT